MDTSRIKEYAYLTFSGAFFGFVFALIICMIFTGEIYLTP